MIDSENNVAPSIYSVYTCPNCSEKIGFQKMHFEERARSEYSNCASGDSRGIRMFWRVTMSLNRVISWTGSAQSVRFQRGPMFVGGQVAIMVIAESIS